MVFVWPLARGQMKRHFNVHRYPVNISGKHKYSTPPIHICIYIHLEHVIYQFQLVCLHSLRTVQEVCNLRHSMRYLHAFEKRMQMITTKCLIQKDRK